MAAIYSLIDDKWTIRVREMFRAGECKHDLASAAIMASLSILVEKLHAFAWHLSVNWFPFEGLQCAEVVTITIVANLKSRRWISFGEFPAGCWDCHCVGAHIHEICCVAMSRIVEMPVVLNRTSQSHERSQIVDPTNFRLEAASMPMGCRSSLPFDIWLRVGRVCWIVSMCWVILVLI